LFPSARDGRMVIRDPEAEGSDIDEDDAETMDMDDDDDGAEKEMQRMSQSDNLIHRTASLRNPSNNIFIILVPC